MKVAPDSKHSSVGQGARRFRQACPVGSIEFFGCAPLARFYIHPMPSMFTRIINRELPAKIFHETDRVIVIADHRPRSPVHLLIIAKEEHPNFHETPAEVLHLLFDTAKAVAEKLGIPDHYQLAVNNGLGQEIDHIHVHFMSNRGMDKLVFKEV